jgi:hypothetical protein
LNVVRDEAESTGHRAGIQTGGEDLELIRK